MTAAHPPSDPTFEQARAAFLLAVQHHEAGWLTEGAHCFEQALACGGDAELNRWFLAAVRGAAPWGVGLPEPAPVRYVQALFDTYAEGFDRHLVQELGYRVPEQLVEGLNGWLGDGWGGPAAPVEVLDLGCGTGLCAQALVDGRRARAQGGVDGLAAGALAIDGVDLSPRMVASARARGLYRRVDEGDVAAWLQACTQRYSLVIAADVFIYIGDLAPVFSGVRRVLAPSGRFAFSVESAATGVELGAQLRYRHGEDHLRQLAAAHGFGVERLQPAVLRHEQQRPIDGLLVWLQPLLDSSPDNGLDNGPGA